MMNEVLQDTIKCAIETGALSFLHDHFSDDVELEIRMAIEPLASVARSRPDVIDRLRDFDKVASAPGHGAPDVIANGERVVACWDEWVSLRSGASIRVQCTMVFDLREGSIARLAIHHDVSPLRTSTRAQRGGPSRGTPCWLNSPGEKAMRTEPMGVRVPASSGKFSVTDGPFAETKEFVGGYAMVGRSGATRQSTSESTTLEGGPTAKIAREPGNPESHW